MEGHEKGEKPPKTPEELAAIAYLDKLRTCEGEAMSARPSCISKARRSYIDVQPLRSRRSRPCSSRNQ